jgi:flagellar hook protein FlgE
MPAFSIPLSGLTASSTALSTIANNLANLNTIGYKDEQVQFSDLFYENLGTDGAGDPIQQGAGTTVSSVSSNFTEGDVTSTGVSTDVAINGNGFFVVQANGVQSFTRAGNFEIGTDNYLETTDGQEVLGYQATNGVISTSQGLGPLALGAGTVSPATTTTNAEITSNLSATDPVGNSYSTNVTVYDSLGASHNITFTFTKTGTNTWTYTASIPLADITPTAGTTPTDPVTLATGALTFDGNGNLINPTSANGSITISTAAVGTLADGANNLSFNWNLFDQNGNGLLTQTAAADSTSSIQQDGSGSGTLVNFNIGSDGTITGSFSNGKTAVLGQIALASFADEQGLSHVGNNDYEPTLASGQPTIGTPGTGGLGTISGGALEQSNADIATEFANLIVAQRSYEANAKVVTTFDQVTQDTINLKQ